jgi:hypothetical protein
MDIFETVILGFIKRCMESAFNYVSVYSTLETNEIVDETECTVSKRWIQCYLTKLYQLQVLFRMEKYDRMTNFGEIQRPVKDTVVFYFRALTRNFPESLPEISVRITDASAEDRTGYLLHANETLCRLRQYAEC